MYDAKEQGVQIVELFYQNQHSAKSIFRRLREFYASYNRISEVAYGRIIGIKVEWKINSVVHNELDSRQHVFYRKIYL